MKKKALLVIVFLFLTIIPFIANAETKVNVYLDSSGSIAGLPGGGSYVLSIEDKVIKELKRKGVNVEVFSFDDNVRKLLSKDDYFVNKNGSTDIKGVGEHIKESNADVAIIISDGKLPQNYTSSYRISTVNTFNHLRKAGVKVCFLSLYKYVLSFPRKISDVVEPSNRVKQLIDKCIPKRQKVQKEISSNNKAKVSTSSSSNSVGVIDPFAFANEVRSRGTVKNVKANANTNTHGVTINIYQK